MLVPTSYTFDNVVDLVKIVKSIEVTINLGWYLLVQQSLFLIVSITFHVQKTEPWETETSNDVEESEEEEEEEEKARKKRKNPKRVRLIDGALYRMNQYGKYFKMQLKEKKWTKVKYEPYDLKSVCVVTRPAYLI